MTDVPARGTAVDLEAVLEVLPDALLVVDLAGTIHHANSTAAQLLGLPRGTLPGASLDGVLEATEATTAPLLARWAGSNAFRPGSLRLRDGRALRCDGARLSNHGFVLLRLRSREAALVPFRQVHDQVETANLRELSRRLEASVADLARSNRQLEAANDEIQQYARAVAHDIRTPLYTIQGFARLLEHEDLVTPDGAEYVQRILESTQRLAAITDGVLAVASLGPEVTATTAVDTTAVARDMLADLDAELQAVDARVVVDELDPVAVPEASLRRVLQNLVVNSLRHAAVPGRPLLVEVSSRVVATDVEIEVRDDGLGIDDAERERIFTLFYRGPAVAGIHGSGIGLATCRKLVHGWGGAITCERVEGPGARFVFTAPAAHTLAAVAAATDDEAPPQEGLGTEPRHLRGRR